jgi:glycosyltransferase involved in cell wall biosynthesis
MVILHVLSPAEVGGLERVVQSLVAGHRTAGHAVYAAVVVTPSAPAPACVRALQAAGAEVLTIPVSARGYFAERAAIAAACDRVRPDVVHTHGYRCDVVDSGVPRQRGIPTVTTVHGFTGGGWKDRLYEGLQRRAFRRFSAVVAVSRLLGAQLERAGVPRNAIHVIRNAWAGGVAFLDRAAARRVLGLPQEGAHIGWVGRLSPEKGPDVVLEAVARLRATSLPVSLSMVGDGWARASLASRAASLGLNGEVKWHGTVPDAARLFAAFDAFVLSSHTEGTPIVLLEAMAAGVPIVATAVGGVPDVLSSAEAWLVPPNDPQRLALAIGAVLADPVEGQRRAAAARRRLDAEFAVAPWLDRYEALYQSFGAVTR